MRSRSAATSAVDMWSMSSRLCLLAGRPRGHLLVDGLLHLRGRVGAEVARHLLVLGLVVEAVHRCALADAAGIPRDEVEAVGDLSGHERRQRGERLDARAAGTTGVEQQGTDLAAAGRRTRAGPRHPGQLEVDRACPSAWRGRGARPAWRTAGRRPGLRVRAPGPLQVPATGPRGRGWGGAPRAAGGAGEVGAPGGAGGREHGDGHTAGDQADGPRAARPGGPGRGEVGSRRSRLPRRRPAASTAHRRG